MGQPQVGWRPVEACLSVCLSFEGKIGGYTPGKLPSSKSKILPGRARPPGQFNTVHALSMKLG